MIIKKCTNYFTNLGIYYGTKLIFFNILSKFIKPKQSKFKIKIKSKKTGKECIYIRPFTTDILLVKNLLMNKGEYDFIYNSKYSWVKEAKVIIDAGACVGMFSRMMKELNSNSQIIAIEPETNNFNILQENLKYSNTACKKNGLWNKKCSLVVEPSKTGEWGFTVRKTEKNEEGDVDAIGIENILNEFNLKCIDILKVDIEGAEVEVFDETASNWLSKVKMCIVEFHERKRPNSSKRIIDLFEKHGFKYEVYEENYIFINENFSS